MEGLIPVLVHKAYLMGVVDPKTKKIVSVSVYSENEGTITRAQKFAFVRIADIRGTSFADCVKQGNKLVNEPWFAWCRDLYC